MSIFCQSLCWFNVSLLTIIQLQINTSRPLCTILLWFSDYWMSGNPYIIYKIKCTTKYFPGDIKITQNLHKDSKCEIKLLVLNNLYFYHESKIRYRSIHVYVKFVAALKLTLMLGNRGEITFKSRGECYSVWISQLQIYDIHSEHQCWYWPRRLLWISPHFENCDDISI